MLRENMHLATNGAEALSIDDLGLRLKDLIPSLISMRLDYSMSKRVLAAMLADVVDQVQVMQQERERKRATAAGHERVERTQRRANQGAPLSSNGGLGSH